MTGGAHRLDEATGPIVIVHVGDEWVRHEYVNFDAPAGEQDEDEVDDGYEYDSDDETRHLRLASSRTETNTMHDLDRVRVVLPPVGALPADLFPSDRRLRVRRAKRFLGGVALVLATCMALGVLLYTLARFRESVLFMLTNGAVILAVLGGMAWRKYE